MSADGARIGENNISNPESGTEAVTLSQSDREQIDAMSADPDLYRKIVRSLAPTVYGHDEIKRGVLLMLLGGVQKETHEGIRCGLGCTDVLAVYALW